MKTATRQNNDQAKEDGDKKDQGKEKDEEKATGSEDNSIISRLGPIEIDWPRSIGYYGGIALAVACEAITPPLAAFIAVYPLLKFINRPKAPTGVRIVSQILEGAAKPVGGDAEGTIRIQSATIPVAGAKDAIRRKAGAKPTPRSTTKSAKALPQRGSRQASSRSKTPETATPATTPRRRARQTSRSTA